MTAYRLLSGFTPPSVDSSDSQPITLGMEFYVDSSGYAVTKAYYPRPGGRTSDTWTMRLWRVDSTTTGTLLAEKGHTFNAGTPVGWTEVVFDSPIPLVANTRYRITGSPLSRYYVATGTWWQGVGPGANGIDNVSLHAPSDGFATGGAQGSFIYDETFAAFPTGTFNGGNYWIDVEVDVDTGGTSVPSNWINHATIAAPRNGTTSHTVDPSSGTVVKGTAFTPTAGRLLLCFAGGAVTSTTPSGWTLPSGGSAIGSQGLYVFTKTATGSDNLTTTHNASDYPAVFDFYEFEVGSSFVAAAGAISIPVSGGTGPVLSGLTGDNWIAAVSCAPVSTGHTSAGTFWSTGSEVVDTFAVRGATTTDGYAYSLTEFNSDTSVSKAASAIVSYVGGITPSSTERLIVAVDPVLPPTGPVTTTVYRCDVTVG